MLETFLGCAVHPVESIFCTVLSLDVVTFSLLYGLSNDDHFSQGSLVGVKEGCLRISRLDRLILDGTER